MQSVHIPSLLFSSLAHLLLVTLEQPGQEPERQGNRRAIRPARNNPKDPQADREQEEIRRELDLFQPSDPPRSLVAPVAAYVRS